MHYDFSKIPSLHNAKITKETENYILIHGNEAPSLETLEGLRSIGLQAVSVSFNWNSKLLEIVCDKGVSCK